MIHIENIDDIYKRNYVFIWLASAFKAGFINSAGFLATGKFVSHVTGFGTQAGIALGHADYFFSLELLIIPVSFITGAIITSWLLDRDYAPGETPKYFWVQSLITFLIGIVIFIGESSLINSKVTFDADNNYNLIEFVVIGILCLICGLKNGLVTWVTSGKIRVTHLTGISTDIGLNFLRSIGVKRTNPRFKERKRVNFIRILTLISFSVGAAISAAIFPAIGYQGFIIVFVISLMMTILSIKDYRQRSQRGRKSSA